jgi:hypothetical protein
MTASKGKESAAGLLVAVVIAVGLSSAPPACGSLDVRPAADASAFAGVTAHGELDPAGSGCRG